jgi:membrane protein DedA with SNARE-associated domain
MAGERSVAGVLAGAGSGAGAPGLLGLLLAMEAGVPVPVPSDLVMLLLGERVSAGALPLWLAALAHGAAGRPWPPVGQPRACAR